MKSHSDGLWPNLLPGKLKRVLKPEKLLASHIERIGNLASEIFHDSAIQAGSSQRAQNQRASLLRRVGTWRMKWE